MAPSRKDTFLQKNRLERAFCYSLFEDSSFKQEGGLFNSDRNVEANEYTIIVQQLIDRGYNVIRIGYKNQNPINISSSFIMNTIGQTKKMI